MLFAQRKCRVLSFRELLDFVTKILKLSGRESPISNHSEQTESTLRVLEDAKVTVASLSIGMVEPISTKYSESTSFGDDSTRSNAPSL
jgi:hypothetical protein